MILRSLTQNFMSQIHVSWLCSCAKPSVRDCSSWYCLLVGNIHSSPLLEKLRDTGLGMNFHRTCISFTKTPIAFQWRVCFVTVSCMWLGIGLSPSCLENTDIQVNIKLISGAFLTAFRKKWKSYFLDSFFFFNPLSHRCLIMLAFSLSIYLFPAGHFGHSGLLSLQRLCCQQR